MQTTRPLIDTNAPLTVEGLESQRLTGKSQKEDRTLLAVIFSKRAPLHRKLPARLDPVTRRVPPAVSACNQTLPACGIGSPTRLPVAVSQLGSRLFSLFGMSIEIQVSCGNAGNADTRRV
jgi:hypothetical protein